MSKPKYLYIDDENGGAETATLHGFNDIGLIEVERFPLSDYKEFGNLKNELLERLKNNGFQGLLLDLRLDGTGEDRTEFNATSLSQELRSIAARNESLTFPIVLCSTEDKIKQTYDSDKTSHDLFDYKISKSNPSPNWLKLSLKLLSLAEGYSVLNNEINKETIFGVELEKIDERMVEKIETLITKYDFAHFVVKNFFHQTNPLINEKILGARLGIDIVKTDQKDWLKLIETIFEKAKYRGIFSSGWNRWWADEVNNIFFSFSGEKLAFINAEKRVEILKKISGIENLKVAKPLKFCNSSEFWNICEAYKVPIDPLEGFKIFTTSDIKSWQEPKFISLLAILERDGVERGLRPHSSEVERIGYTKELLGIK